MKTVQKDYDNKCNMLNGKIQSLLKEVAGLSRATSKKDRVAAARESANSANSANSGSGTDSPSIS